MEQWFIDNLKPWFNIRQIAENNLGCKKSNKTRKEMSKIKTKLWIDIKNDNERFSNTKKILMKNLEIATEKAAIKSSFKVIILMEDGTEKIYNSYRLAAKDLKCSHKTIINKIKNPDESGRLHKFKIKHVS